LTQSLSAVELDLNAHELGNALEGVKTLCTVLPICNPSPSRQLQFSDSGNERKGSGCDFASHFDAHRSDNFIN